MTHKINIPKHMGTPEWELQTELLAKMNEDMRIQREQLAAYHAEQSRIREEKRAYAKANPLTVAQAIEQLRGMPSDAIIHSEGCDCTGVAAYAEYDKTDNTVLIVRVDNV